MEQLRKSRLNCWIKDIGRSKHMLDTRYYEGYEGEGEVKVWSEENGNEDGIVIWIGFFNTILVQNSRKMELLSAILIKMDSMMKNGR